MKNNLQVKGRLRLYLQWPTIMIAVLLVMNIWICIVDRRAGIAMGFCTLAYTVVVLLMYAYNKSVIRSELVELGTQYGMLQNVLLKDLHVPYAIMTDDGRLVWMNDAFLEVFDGGSRIYMSKYVHELNKGVFPKNLNEKKELDIHYDGRDYLVRMQKICLDSTGSTYHTMGTDVENQTFIALSMTDITELNAYIRECEGRRLVAGLVYIDNYEEVMESVEEVRQSLLVALIDRKLNQYMANYDAIVKKLEKDKYFFVVKRSHFRDMEADKFSVLEDVKTVSVGNTLPVTLSMGIGISTESYTQSYNFARVSIDLSLARGGDQAVVKKGADITYYGGKREQTSKNTRVKARVKAEAFREFIASKDQIIVMGHKIADVDSFGAAIGIYRAAKTLGKKAYIVLNEVTSSVRPFYNSFMENPAYPDDIFVKSDGVPEIITDNTMVVVVDTNRPDNTDCPELLRLAKTLVVFDHHRQNSNIIENTVLSYIEPYASSACEMVAEVLQYIADEVKIAAVEANSMYAGIMIDTNNFMNRTGVRTFEAAAFLRRCGADITHVRKIFRDNLESYRAKASIVGRAEIFRGEYAIATYSDQNMDSPTIIGAQAANEMLNIEGVKASFVLTKYNGKIYVSARAIDEVNVQIIMERMGGGGHLNTAGAQFAHTDLKEAVAALKDIIDEMAKKGDI